MPAQPTLSRSAVPGVILAGGLATRMGGGDKGLLRLGDRCLLDHVIDRLGPQCGALALSANGDPDRFAALGLPVLADTLPDRPGPLAGILAGLDWAAGQGAEAIVTAAADTPFLPRCLVARLRAGAGSAGLAIAASRGPDGTLHRHPTVGLWPVTLREDLRGALHGGLRKVGLWAERNAAVLVEFPSDPVDPFFNVNTPPDLAEAERLLERL